MPDMRKERDWMVDRQIADRGVTDRRVLEAMRRVPREAFVSEGFEDAAYDDGPLPIGHGQTISQPYIVALMIEAAEIDPGDRVLEIGTGSGYAAAVIAEITTEVHTVERHAPLAETAARRLDAAGYVDVSLHVGDGTLGWPNAAPFDAIIVAAGGPSVPVALREQLKEGGRLILPVGRAEPPQGQKLVRVRRTGPATWQEETLSSVRFVPLIGALGWTETGDVAADGPQTAGPSLPDRIAAAAEPLSEIGSEEFAKPFDRYAGRRVVLLGESSHGTAEFYAARAAITRRLIEHHGFTIVAVEAAWPDAAAIDRYVSHRPPRSDGDRPFSRFPTWMWRNTEVEGFTRWLRGHNAAIDDPARRTGFYGLDLYNLHGSIAAVLDYLDAVDPDAARIARERYGCLTPWQKDPATYGRTVLNRGYGDCEDEVVAQLRALLDRQMSYQARDGESFLDAAQNARLIRSAERYYRLMYYGGAESWNLRDTHMFETLEHILKARGPWAKAVVWAHNSHIGDARATGMGKDRDEINIGQLCRQRWGDAAALIGFGTHAGTVAAASDWGGEMEVKQVRPSREDSVERLFHDADQPRCLLDMAADDALRQDLAEDRLERFIGVIYRPETEKLSHYASASLSRQFDAWVWFDETSAVTPLGPEHRREGVPETWPFGL